MERILLFVFAIAFAGLVINGVSGLSHGVTGARLYLLAALFVLGLLVMSWRRLSASLRRGRRDV